MFRVEELVEQSLSVGTKEQTALKKTGRALPGLGLGGIDLAPGDVRKVWDSVTGYLSKNFEAKKGVKLSHFARFSFLKSTGKPVFTLDSDFVKHSGCRVRNTVLQRPEVNSIDLNFSHLSRECQMPKDTVKFIYLRMISVIERVVRTGEITVFLEFPEVGVLVGDRFQLTFQYCKDAARVARHMKKSQSATFVKLAPQTSFEISIKGLPPSAAKAVKKARRAQLEAERAARARAAADKKARELRQRRLDGEDAFTRVEMAQEESKATLDAEVEMEKPEVEESQQNREEQSQRHQQQRLARRKVEKKQKQLSKEREEEIKLAAEIQRLQEEERKEAARRKKEEEPKKMPNVHFPFRSGEEAREHERMLKKEFQKEVNKEIDDRAAQERMRQMELARDDRPSYEIEPSEMLTQTLDGTAILINPEYAGDFEALDTINKKRYAGTVTLLSKTAALGPGSPGITLYPKFLTPELETSRINANSVVKERVIMDAYKRYEDQLVSEEERIMRLDNEVRKTDKKADEREKKKVAQRKRELQRTNEYLRLQVEDREVRKKIQKHERIGPKEFVPTKAFPMGKVRDRGEVERAKEHLANALNAQVRAKERKMQAMRKMEQLEENLFLNAVNEQLKQDEQHRKEKVSHEKKVLQHEWDRQLSYQETFRELQQQMWKTGQNKRKKKKKVATEEGGVVPGEYETEGGLLPSLSVTGLGNGKPKGGRR